MFAFRAGINVCADQRHDLVVSIILNPGELIPTPARCHPDGRSEISVLRIWENNSRDELRVGIEIDGVNLWSHLFLGFMPRSSMPRGILKDFGYSSQVLCASFRELVFFAG